MTVRKVALADIDEIMKVYEAAREYMKKTGNPNQWGNNKPYKETLLSDIQKEQLYAVTENGEIYGAFAFIYGDDPTYSVIDGEWKNSDEYYTLHRVASNGKKGGVMKTCLEYCKKLAGNIRIDTHKDNINMQKHILDNGFEYCGIIYLEDGNPRLAYHWRKI